MNDLVYHLRCNAPIRRDHYMHRAADLIEQLQRENSELLAALEMIAGKRYCLDAIMSNSDIAKAAIASVKESK